MIQTIRAITLIFTVFFMTNVSANASANLIPRSVLFGNPEKAMVRLSNDGKHVSYLAPSNGILNLWIAPKDNISAAKVVTHDTDRGIRQYYWAYDNKHVLFLQDYKGDENFRLYSYNIDTNKTQLLTPEHGVKTVLYKNSIDKPSEILVGLNKRKAEYFDVYLLNLADSSLKLLLENDKFSEVIADNDLQIRFAVFMNSDGEEEYFERKGDTWAFYMKTPSEDSKTTGIIGFNKTNSALYWLDSRNRNTAALRSMSIESGKFTTIAEDKRTDIGVAAVHPTQKTIQAIAIDYDKPIIKVLDKAIEKDIEFLKSKHQGYFTITSRSTDDKLWLVAYADDVTPPNYYIYDRTSRTMQFLFSAQSKLARSNLAPMKPVIIQSRDGLDMVSYLTLPSSANAEKVLPMVLYVHGGPWVRDSWGINPVHQWLANRGYAVLSVNYRGSTGFGKNFTNAGNMEWGRKMHDDLIDSVNWAIKNKIADPSKICIMGGSYGGYATLAGLTFTPDVFACGVDIVGPSNLLTLLKSFPPYWKPILSDMKKRVGAWETAEDIKDLAARSPITFVDNIVKPLLIGQGAHDPRVKQAESDQIVDVMKKRNIPVVYALYHSEGHGFAKPSNRLSFYALTEQFLSKILGGQAESIGKDLEGSDFTLNGEKDPSSAKAVQIINDNI
jgi:dipeptidyl aminopeptidase/acylaminoacyl peptidase